MLDAHALAAGRVWAATTFPYLASALFATTVVPASGVPGGAAVDEGWRLYVDPVAVAGWTPQQLGALLVHHAGHLVRDHAGRARGAGVDEETAHRWTLACDAELNDDLAAVGVVPPDPVVMPETLGGRRNRMAEEYFGLGADAAGATEVEAHDHGSGTHGIRRPWEADGDGAERSLPPEQADLVRRRVAVAVAAAERADVPGGWRRWADALLRPAVDWRRALAAEIRRGVSREAGRVDYSYRRPSRRATVAGPVVLPAMERPSPAVAVVVDTSGSMADAHLLRAMSEIDGLLRSVGVRDGVTVLAVDAAVHEVRRVHNARQVALTGGGGTDMAEGIAAAMRLRPRPSVVVVLTDGLTPWPAEGPRGASVVVALVDKPRHKWPPPPWARVVLVDADEPAA